MSKIFANVSISANGDTFGSWITKTNLGLAAYAYTVTVASNTSGDMSTGNGFVVGIFGANTLVANVIAGGNVSSQSPLTILGTVNFSNNNLISYNNVATTYNFNYNTSNTQSQIVDTFVANTYAGGKYLISIKNNLNIDRHLTEIMVMATGANAHITEYASLINNTSLGTFSANVDTGTARLWFTPTNANNTLQIKKDVLAS